jgi:hypothetical protein
MLQDVAQLKTYIGFAWFVSSEPGDDSFSTCEPSKWPSNEADNPRRRLETMTE